jgi:hypothetical protein
MKQTTLKAPFPWFGGKSRVADLVWSRFGNPLNYVEPFAGSLAVLLKRPTPPRTETVNDRDYYLANFWRAVQADPEAVAHYADWPVNEADLHARHLWLVQQDDFRERMMLDPDFYDAKIAGWWVWGQSAWIGGGWCKVDYSPKSGITKSGDKTERRRPSLTNTRGHGVITLDKKRPNLPQRGGRGVHQDAFTKNGRSRPSLRPAQGIEGLSRHLPELKGGKGVNRQIPSLQGASWASGGVHAKRVQSDIYTYMAALQERLRRVRVVCGDWTRIMGPSVTYKIGMTGIFLDPPYGDSRTDGLYAVDSLTIADEVRTWCLAEIEDGRFQGPRYLHPKLRIALCGLDGEHDELEALGWEVVAWKTNGGYGNQGQGTNANKHRERIWFSPNCLTADIRNFWMEE